MWILTVFIKTSNQVFLLLDNYNLTLLPYKDTHTHIHRVRLARLASSFSYTQHATFSIQIQMYTKMC